MAIVELLATTADQIRFLSTFFQTCTMLTFSLNTNNVDKIEMWYNINESIKREV